MVGSEDTIMVTLGDMSERVEARLRSGHYDSASDVVRAALRALDREEGEDDVLRRKVAQALSDPRPSIPADEVFPRLRAKRAERAVARAEAAERDL